MIPKEGYSYWLGTSVAVHAIYGVLGVYGSFEEYHMLLKLHLLHPDNHQVLQDLPSKSERLKLNVTVILVQSCILYFNLLLHLPCPGAERVYSQYF
jgi:hypothetical protein